MQLCHRHLLSKYIVSYYFDFLWFDDELLPSQLACLRFPRNQSATMVEATFAWLHALPV